MPVRYACVLLAIAMILPATASSSVPSPGYSTVPACLSACPQGDIPFAVVVRDLAGNPVAMSSVVLDVSQCAQVQVCPAQDPAVVWDPGLRTLRGFTGAAGQITFHVRAGGLCPGSGIRVFADGIALLPFPIPVASPDQDASLSVYGNDRQLLEAGAYATGKDLNCDGVRDAADVAVFEAHAGHLCDAVVPVRPRAWGALKIRYR